MSAVPREHDRSFLTLLLLCASVVMVLAFTTGRATGHNPLSRLATIDALVHDGTLAIDQSPFSNTVDKIMVEGKLYSSKAPLLSVLGAGVYTVLFEVFGLSLRDEGRPFAVFWLNMILGIGPHLLLLVFADRILRLWQHSDQSRLLVLAVLGFGQLGLGYATTLNNHVPAAAALMAAFYFTLRVRNVGEARTVDLLLASFLAGLAPTLDFGASVMSLGLLVLLAPFRSVNRALPVALGVLIPGFVHTALNHAITGGFLPTPFRGELYRFPGSYWTAPVGIDALREDRFTYAFHSLLGHHGLLTMTPLLVLGLVALVQLVRARGQLWREALVVGLAFSVALLYYLFRTRNYGGVCVGFRWMLAYTPFVLLFLGGMVETLNKARFGMPAFVLLFVIGQYHATNGLQNPWHHSVWHQLVSGEPGARSEKQPAQRRLPMSEPKSEHASPARRLRQAP